MQRDHHVGERSGGRVKYACQRLSVPSRNVGVRSTHIDVLRARVIRCAWAAAEWRNPKNIVQPLGGCQVLERVLEQRLPLRGSSHRPPEPLTIVAGFVEQPENRNAASSLERLNERGDSVQVRIEGRVFGCASGKHIVDVGSGVVGASVDAHVVAEHAKTTVVPMRDALSRSLAVVDVKGADRRVLARRGKHGIHAVLVVVLFLTRKDATAVYAVQVAQDVFRLLGGVGCHWHE